MRKPSSAAAAADVTGIAAAARHLLAFLAEADPDGGPPAGRRPAGPRPGALPGTGGPPAARPPHPA